MCLFPQKCSTMNNRASARLTPPHCLIVLSLSHLAWSTILPSRLFWVCPWVFVSSDTFDTSHTSCFPQLEGRLEELLTELRESRDKLVQQDKAAKAALQQAQKEMAHRVDQVQPGRKHFSNVWSGSTHCWLHL